MSFETLNSLVKTEDASTPLGPMHFTYSGGWWAICPDTGFGYWYESLADAVRHWNVQIVNYEHYTWKAERVN